MSGIEKLVERLIDGRVEFVIVGGFAATVHGSSCFTQDLDVSAPFEEENLVRLVTAVAQINPRVPSIPPQEGYRNLCVITDEGELDLIGEVAGVGTWPAVLEHSIEVELSGRTVKVLDLDALIASRKALSREKDLPQLAELEVIRARLRRRG